MEPGVGTPDGAWDLEEVLQEEVRPRSGEGGVNADEGVSRAGEGERDLERIEDVTVENCTLDTHTHTHTQLPPSLPL